MKRFATAGLVCFLALGLSSTAGAADKNARTWGSKCASCHGEDGKAQTAKGKEMGVKDMTTKEWQKITDAKIKEGIENGAKSTVGGKTFEMEGYKDKLKPDQIDGLVQYIRTLGK